MSKYQNELPRLAASFAALSNPHRLALFERLCRCCAPGTSCSVDQAMKVTVGELGAGLALAPSTVSHHLKTLRHAGLIQTERRGKQVFCWVDPDVLRDLSDFFLTPLSLGEGVCCSGAINVPIE